MMICVGSETRIRRIYNSSSHSNLAAIRQRADTDERADAPKNMFLNTIRMLLDMPELFYRVAEGPRNEHDSNHLKIYIQN